jgi:hypothetical protein
VSFKTSFDSKQPKLEPKLVSALSEAKCLFRLFRFNTETESFDVSIEPKQTDQPKQFDREHIFSLLCTHSVCCVLTQSVVYTGRGRFLFSSTAPQPTTRYLVLSKNETDSS